VEVFTVSQLLGGSQTVVVGTAEMYNCETRQYKVRSSYCTNVGAFVSDSDDRRVNAGPGTVSFYMLCERADVHKVRNSVAQTMWSAAMANADQVAHCAAILVANQHPYQMS